MLCKKCKNDIPVGSIFCNWCGTKQLRERKKKDGGVSIPSPRQLASGKWNIELRAEGVSGTFDTAAQCRDWARAVRAGYIEAKKNHSKMTVGKAIDLFLSDNSNVLSPSTLKGYKSYRKTRFTSLMDKDPAKPINWQAAINAEAAAVSPKSVANAWRLITVSLKTQGYDIPAVTLPKIAKASRPWLDYEEIQSFLKLIYGQPCELGALLALHGLRRSELLALDSSKIDLGRETISVSGAAVYGPDGDFVYKNTNKNARSQRVVPILIPRLKELLKDVDGLLITSKPNTLYVQVNRLCRQNGLPEVGVHGLRHSFASLAYHLGWSEATTMSVGGWSNSKTVHDIYTHHAQKDKNRDIKKMQRFYEKVNFTNEFTNS